MAYHIVIRPTALRTLSILAGDDARRIRGAIDRLGHDPRPHGVKKLRGAVDLYRIRVGDYRIVYQIEQRIITVTVVRIGHRREVYRERFGG